MSKKKIYQNYNSQFVSLFNLFNSLDNIFTGSFLEEKALVFHFLIFIFIFIYVRDQVPNVAPRLIHEPIPADARLSTTGILCNPELVMYRKLFESGAQGLYTYKKKTIQNKKTFKVAKKKKGSKQERKYLCILCEKSQISFPKVRCGSKRDIFTVLL